MKRPASILVVFGLLAAALSDPSFADLIGRHSMLGRHWWYWQLLPTVTASIGLTAIAIGIGTGIRRP